jgi:hypothetical protein
VTILPERVAEPEPLGPLSIGAVLAGVLSAYGLFVLVISVAAGFANGAHANQQLSGATWKQLGTGGGIVTGVALFWAWVFGGFVAGRLAGREPVRHGIWVFVTGVMVLTVVATAVTWFPDTAAVVRNLRVLGLPVRRNEWSDVLGAAGLASLLGMLAGSVVGTRWGMRGAAAVSAPVPKAVPEIEPEVEPVPAFVDAEPAPLEPAAEPSEPQLFTDEPEPEPGLLAAWAAPAVEHEERAPEPTIAEEPAASPWWTPPSAPEPEPEPAPAEPVGFVEPVAAEPVVEEPVVEHVPSEPFPSEPLSPEPPPPAPPSFWPQAEEPLVGAEPASAADEGWALPDVDAPSYAEEAPAFGEPVRPAEPVTPEPVEAEPASYEWPAVSGGYEAPPEADPEPQLYQDAPEALPDGESEEEELRRRQREDAARAYEQARDEQ